MILFRAMIKTDRDRPSFFSLKAQASDEEIWNHVLLTLTKQEQENADRSHSQIEVPHLGSKEITIKSKENKVIAFAALNEVKGDKMEWAVYREI